MIHTLAIIPEKASFSIQDLGEAPFAGLDDPAPKFRAGYVNVIKRVAVSWQVNPEYYEYLRAFYHATANGSLPFKINLFYESHLLETYLAYFVPKTFVMNNFDGHTFIIQAELLITDLASYS